MRQREAVVQVRGEAERPLVLDRLDARRHGARDVRDHDQLVDLRRERGQRLLELARRCPCETTTAETFTRAPAGRPRPSGAPSPPTRRASRARCPAATSALALGERAADGGAEVAVVGVHGRVAADLAQRRLVGGDDRRAAGHRLEHRQAEALVARREHERRGAAVEVGELVLSSRSRAGRRRPRAARARARAPSRGRRRRAAGRRRARRRARRAGPCAPGSRRRRAGRASRRRCARPGMKAGVDAVRRHRHLRRRARRRARRRRASSAPRRRARGRRAGRRAARPILKVSRSSRPIAVGVALEREVVHRDDGAARGSRAAARAGSARARAGGGGAAAAATTPCAAPASRAGSSIASTPVGHELGVPRHRREAEVGRDAPAARAAGSRRTSRRRCARGRARRRRRGSRELLVDRLASRARPRPTRRRAAAPAGRRARCRRGSRRRRSDRRRSRRRPRTPPSRCRRS